jgi:hypothetical protein
MGTTVAKQPDQRHLSVQEIEQRDALVERLFEAVPGFNDPHRVYVGSIDGDKHIAYRYAFRST